MFFELLNQNKCAMIDFKELFPEANTIHDFAPLYPYIIRYLDW